MTTPEQEQWEQRFDLLWGEAPPGTPKYDKGESIKSLFRDALLSREKEMIERLEGIIEQKRKNLVVMNAPDKCRPRCHASGKDDALSDLLQEIEKITK